MNILTKYFDYLSDAQKNKFAALKPLYSDWNSKINVISRKDMDHFYEKHVLHSLGIAKIINFTPNTKILDIGTGGGFPGIPLAILFPEVDFHLVDSIGKKIKVVTGVAEALGLTNIKAEHQRAENIKGSYDFITCRAVTRMNGFLHLAKGKIKKENNNSLPNGILALKGGDLKEELEEIKKYNKSYSLSDHYDCLLYTSPSPRD